MEVQSDNAMADTSLSMPADCPPELNPNLDRTSLAQAFAQKGRVHIANVLTDASAQRLFYALEQETPWGLMFNEGDKVRVFDTISEEAHQQAAIAAWQRAHSDYQYFHRYHHLVLKRGSVVSPDHYLGKLVAFLTSPRFLAFTREVTGFDAIASVTGSATLYKPLDFCTTHDDRDPGGKRLAAYVLNMTPKWRPDWGGALQFFDGDDRIEEGYLPTFNALNLFRVPRRHAISQVAMYGGLRYSVSGWLSSGEQDV
jgi:SM-20-related protein